MINKIPVFILLLLVAFQGFSQDKIYLDVNMKEIDSLPFKSICKNRALKCLEYTSDSIIINKVLPKYSFGKISPEAYNQIRSVLELDSKTAIKPGSKIIIRYSDSLFNDETILRKQMTLFKNHNKNNKNNKKKTHHVSNGFLARIIPNDSVLTKMNFKRFNTQKNKYVNKCIKKYKKQDLVSINIVYNIKEEGFDNFESVSKTKDRGIFKNTFFKIYNNYKLLILKPDGEYFLSGYYVTNKNMKLLLENKDWSEYKLDLLEFENKGEYINNSFFKDPIMNLNLKHCF